MSTAMDDFWDWVRSERSVGGKRPPPTTAPNLKRRPAGAMDDIIPTITKREAEKIAGLSADDLREMIAAKEGGNMISFSPAKPPSEAAIDQVLREKAAERAAAGLYPVPDFAEREGDWPVPLSKTDEFKAAVKVHRDYDMPGIVYVTFLDLLDLIKSREGS